VGGRKEAMGLGLGLGWGRWCGCGCGCRQGSRVGGSQGGGRVCNAATGVWMFGPCVFSDPDEGPS
jgi:hypothetical protein